MVSVIKLYSEYFNHSIRWFLLNLTANIISFDKNYWLQESIKLSEIKWFLLNLTAKLHLLFSPKKIFGRSILTKQLTYVKPDTEWFLINLTAK